MEKNTKSDGIKVNLETEVIVEFYGQLRILKEMTVYSLKNMLECQSVIYKFYLEQLHSNKSFKKEKKKYIPVGR